MLLNILHNSKETPAQVFSFKLWEIFKNKYITENLRKTAFENLITKFMITKQLYSAMLPSLLFSAPIVNILKTNLLDIN